jgi:hypothetical protein
MKSVQVSIAMFTLPLLLSATPAWAVANNALSADDIIRQAVARAQKRADSANRSGYAYTKVAVTEELDGAGKVTDRQKRVYEVQFQSGETFLKLVELNGKPLASSDRKKQAENEAKFSRLLGQSKNGKGDRRENFLTADLVARFDFRFACREEINGRTAFQLKFQPKNPTPPSHHIIDRFLDRMSGTLWVDTEDFEVARVDIKLGSQVDLLGGVLGSLKKMAFTLVRTRLADGQWFNVSSNGDFEGRKLLDSTRYKTTSRCVNFRPTSLR